MPLKKALNVMPVPLRVMFFVFLFTPLASLSFIGSPLDVLAVQGKTRFVAVLLAYWIAPLGICYSLGFRHFLFLPLYAIQCAALVLHSVVYSSELPLDMALARYVLIGFMGYVGFFFGNKDFVYPFLTRDFRIWRKSKRLRVTYDVYLMGDRPEHKCPARMRDCSSAGLAVEIDERHLETFLKKRKEGDVIRIAMRWGSQEHVYPTHIVWTATSPRSRSLGLELEPGHSLKAFVAWVQEQMRIERRLLRRTMPILEHDVHQTALTFWVLFIVLSFGIPAFAHL